MTCLCFMTGCGTKIFETEKDKYTITRYSNKELENKIYYIKDGSSFYKMHTPEGSKNIYWLGKDISLIPNLYNDELIALRSQNTSEKAIRVTRYYDQPSSPGIYGIKTDAEGFYIFSTKESCVKDSDAARKLSKSHSPNIQVISINGKAPGEYGLSSAGTLEGFSEGEEIAFEVYSGTDYETFTIISDTHFIYAGNDVLIDDIYQTKNGYLAYIMPETSKNGYYVYNGALFRYHSHEKGMCAAEGDDLNEMDYGSAYEEMLSQYDQYFIIVNEMTYDVGFRASYSGGEDCDVKCVMQAPDGEIYEMNVDSETHSISLELSEIEAGRWTLNIYPKGVSLDGNVEIISTRKERDSICEEINVTIDKDIAYGEFYVTLSGEANVWGTVENTETHESHEMYFKNARSQNDRPSLSCEWQFITPGTYKIRVWHYNDVAIESGSFRELQPEGSEEIIVIEE